MIVKMICFYSKIINVLLSCCPSTYSCNGGCVCTTQQQKTLGQGRAGNNTVSDGPKPAEDITN